MDLHDRRATVAATTPAAAASLAERFGPADLANGQATFVVVTADESSTKRIVPHVRFGANVVFRDRNDGNVIDAVEHLLCGIEQQSRSPERCWVALRAFAKDDTVVLAQLVGDTLVNDPALARQQIRELPVWAVAVEPSTAHGTLHATGHATVDVPVAPLHGQASIRYALAGIVTDHPPRSTGEVAGSLATASTHRTWLSILDQLSSTHRIVSAADRPTQRRAISDMFAIQ